MEVHDFHENDDKEESKKRSVDLIERLKKCNFKVDYDSQVLQGECGNLIAKRIPKMKIVHMLVDVNGNREKESIKQFKENYKFKKLITYIHESQKGKYLEFAGFKKDKKITYSKNCKGWANRPNRLKSNLQPKIRYVYDN